MLDLYLFRNLNQVRERVMSRSEMIRKRGRDPDEVFSEIARDQKTINDLGILIPLNPGATFSEIEETEEAE